MDNNSTILIVDDEKVSAKILKKFLAENYNVVMAENGADALQILEKREIQLVLLDIVMKGMDGYEVCRRIKENPNTKNIPIIFVTARNEYQDESKGLDMGAVDYIKKPYYLPIVKARVKTQLKLKEKNDILENLIAIDGLTGVYNRRKYDKYILENYNRMKTETAGLLMMDVDDFKAYNDNYGHGAGDECLIKIAATINAALSEKNILFARYGGEEFVAFFKDITMEELEEYAVEILKIVEGLKITHEYSSNNKNVTISIGGSFRKMSKGKNILDVFLKTDRKSVV